MNVHKIADFFALAKEYDEQRNRIVKIKVCRGDYPFRPVNPCLIGEFSAIWDRKEIIEYINNNPATGVRVPLLTCPKNVETGFYEEGEEVLLYEHKGEYFIRTKGNKNEDDNLGELPDIKEDE